MFAAAVSKVQNRKEVKEVKSSIMETIVDIYSNGLKNELRAKRRLNIFLSIFIQAVSITSRNPLDELCVDTRQLKNYLLQEQEKLRRFMLLAADGRILIPPITTYSNSDANIYEESACFLSKFSLARSIVCSWLIACSTKLDHLFNLQTGVDNSCSLSKIAFLSLAEECFQRLSHAFLSSSVLSYHEYTHSHCDKESLLAFVELLKQDRTAYMELVIERGDFGNSLADRDLNKAEECVFGGYIMLLYIIVIIHV